MPDVSTAYSLAQYRILRSTMHTIPWLSTRYHTSAQYGIDPSLVPENPVDTAKPGTTKQEGVPDGKSL
eukprot:3546928-Rhodomonas_salina.1